VPISVDLSSLTKVSKALNGLGKTATKVLAISANESAAHARTVAKQTVLATYNLKSSDVMKTMSVRKASGGSTTAEMRVSSHNIPMIKTGPQPAQPQPGRRPKLTVEIIRGSRRSAAPDFVAAVGKGAAAYGRLGRKSSLNIAARKAIRRDLLKAKAVHLGVFKRTGKKRLPIQQEFTTGVAAFTFAKRTHDVVRIKSGDYFQKRVVHNIGASLEGYIR
jgi:hypothetical protein